MSLLLNKPLHYLLPLEQDVLALVIIYLFLEGDFSIIVDYLPFLT